MCDYTNYINVHLRDGKELPFEEWDKLLREDMLSTKEEDSEYPYSVEGLSELYRDLWECCDYKVNGHIYTVRQNYTYSDAEELLGVLATENGREVLIKILKMVPEDILKECLLKLDRVEDISNSDDETVYLLKYEDD